MQLHFFAIPALDPVAAQTALSQFIAAHRGTGVERQFVQAGTESHWALCISIVAGPGPGPLPAGLTADATRSGQTMDQTACSRCPAATSRRVLFLQAPGVPVGAWRSDHGRQLPGWPLC